jgi:hypothetical protein
LSKAAAGLNLLAALAMPILLLPGVPIEGSDPAARLTYLSTQIAGSRLVSRDPAMAPYGVKTISC